MIRGGEIAFGLVAILIVLALGFISVLGAYGMWVKFQGWRRDREIQKLGSGPRP